MSDSFGQLDNRPSIVLEDTLNKVHAVFVLPGTCKMHQITVVSSLTFTGIQKGAIYTPQS